MSGPIPSDGTFAELASRMSAWFIDALLPLWAERGFDRDKGWFSERLDGAAMPARDMPHRLVSQARQVYVYSTAARLGWFPSGAELAHQGIATIRSKYRSPDGLRGYVAALGPDGRVLNAARETYSHDFVLLALAAYYQLTGDAGALVEAREVVGFLDDALASGDRRGFLNRGGSPERDQDPQMHYLEAMLLWYEATGDGTFLARASGIVDLFRERLWQPDCHAVAEHFDADWNREPGYRGTFYRPGHHYEWASLLRLYGQHAGRPTDSMVTALHRTADAAGLLPDGRVVDEVSMSGRLRAPSTRLWPQCERVRATCLEHERGVESTAAMTSALQVLARFCRTDGLWTEHLDLHGRSMVSFAPATSPYHLLGAVAEAARAASR